MNPRIASALLVPGLLLTAALTLVPGSATIIWDIQYLPLHLAAMTLLLIGSALTPSRPCGQDPLIPLISLSLLAIGWIAGAYYGPFPHRALLYALPGLFAVSTGCLWMLNGSPELFQTRGFRIGLALFLLLWSALSLYRFTTLDMLPVWREARFLDEAAEGGLFNILWSHARPRLRNSHPTGHQNYNSGFLLLALPLLWTGLRSKSDRLPHLLSASALGGGILILLTLQSRNTFFGLLLGAGILLLNLRGRSLRLPGSFWILAPLSILLFLALSPRILQTLTTFSPGRLGMWKGALLTGQSYFPFGSGEGLTPEMLHFFSHEIGPRWPSSIQFHQTWLHFWAIGGVPSALGILLLTAWTVFRMLTVPRKDDLHEHAPALFALAATFAVMLADYQWDIYPITLLLLLHLSRLTPTSSPPTSDLQPLTSPSPLRTPQFALLLPPLAALLTALSVVPAALRSRAAIDDAGLAVENDELTAAIAHFERANRLFPEPYALNMAGQLLARDPAHHAAAIDTFNRSLALWESQPIAHDFLAELLFRASDEYILTPSERRNLLQQTLQHARRTAETAPDFRGVHLRHARILLRLEAPHRDIFEILTEDFRHSIDLLLPQIWAHYPELAPLREPFLRHFMALEISPDDQSNAVLGNRQAWVQKLGQDPIGAEIHPDFRERVEKSLQLRPSFRLLQSACDANQADQAQAFRRLFVFLFRQPLDLNSTQAFLTQTLPPNPTFADFFTVPPLQHQTLRFSGHGIQARHPRSIPLPRLFPAHQTPAHSLFR